MDIESRPARVWFRSALMVCMAIALVSCQDRSTDRVPETQTDSGSGGPSVAASPEAIAAGMGLYTENGCGVCHGRDGSGKGPLAHTIQPPPRDYRDPSAYKQGTSVAEIADTIAAGVGGASSKMPQYLHLSEEERTLIGQYIVSLQHR
jgi:mono/diheme cytochrome c family protein